MAKTRGQTENITVKKEEEEDIKPTALLNSASNVPKNKITKRKPSKNKNKTLPDQQVKVEEDTDTKSLLKSTPNCSKLQKGQRVSQKQINRLIHYIVNDGMSIKKASQKVNISICSASYYYNVYKNDREKRIPAPRNGCRRPQNSYTQEQIGNLIKHIVDDKMNIKEASAKVNMHYSSGFYHYSRYLKDPNHNIPITRPSQIYTQDQKNEFIGYVINDKMSIKAALKKAKMNCAPSYYYFHKYFKEQNPNVATPSRIAISKYSVQEQRKELIGYIVDNKMSIAAASRKANINRSTARRYYQQYLKDNNMEIPVGKNYKRFTQDEINKLIGYIIDDKMSVRAASKKVDMPEYTGYKYYRKYQKSRNIDFCIRKCITPEQKSELVRYIVDDKMSIAAASKKANMGYDSGTKYYRQYLKNQKFDTPTD